MLPPRADQGDAGPGERVARGHRGRGRGYRPHLQAGGHEPRER